MGYYFIAWETFVGEGSPVIKSVTLAPKLTNETPCEFYARYRKHIAEKLMVDERDCVAVQFNAV